MNENGGRRGAGVSAPGMRAFFLGRVPFAEAWALQRWLWEERAAGRWGEDALLFLDHEPVLTLGQGGSEANVLGRRPPGDGGETAGGEIGGGRTAGEEEGAEGEEEVPLVRVNRGGEVTFHGPGQLMLYAVCDLRARERDVHLHCRRLEEVFVRYLAGRGLRAERRPGNPGLWVGGAKILSLGVGARRWVTMHGVAFNVSTDLRFFEMIHPCGEIGGRVTSLERLTGEAPPLEELAGALAPLCAEVFGGKVTVEPDAGWLLARAAAGRA